MVMRAFTVSVLLCIALSEVGEFKLYVLQALNKYKQLFPNTCFIV